MARFAGEKRRRVEAALGYHGFDPRAVKMCDLFLCLQKRTTADSLNNLVQHLIGILEPPSCWMTHCKHYGNSTEFCNCGLEKVPGRCSINRAFKKRQAERKAKHLEKFNESMADLLAVEIELPDTAIPSSLWEKIEPVRLIQLDWLIEEVPLDD